MLPVLVSVGVVVAFPPVFAPVLVLVAKGVFIFICMGMASGGEARDRANNSTY